MCFCSIFAYYYGTKNKTFNIYCDESTHLPNDGCPYMIYGYVSVASNQIKMIREQLKAIKTKYAFNGEWKWTGIHDKTYQMYRELVEYFSRYPA